MNILPDSGAPDGATTTFDPEAETLCDSNPFEYLVWQATECLPLPESHALQPGVLPAVSTKLFGGGTPPGNFMKSRGPYGVPRGWQLTFITFYRVTPPM